MRAHARALLLSFVLPLRARPLNQAALQFKKTGAELACKMAGGGLVCAMCMPRRAAAVEHTRLTPSGSPVGHRWITGVGKILK